MFGWKQVSQSGDYTLMKDAYGDNKGVEGKQPKLQDLDLLPQVPPDTAGVGQTLKNDCRYPLLIDVPSLERHISVLKKKPADLQQSVSSKVNVREFIASTASAFLCNFIIKDGNLA